MTDMLSNVWLATCPRFSPVTMAFELNADTYEGTLFTVDHYAQGDGGLVYSINAAAMPSILRTLFAHPQTVPVPFSPFLTQYDTYLMRYEDIAD